LNAPKAASGENRGFGCGSGRTLAATKIDKKRRRGGEEQSKDQNSFHDCRS
jgi:hypothetical protein